MEGKGHSKLKGKPGLLKKYNEVKKVEFEVVSDPSRNAKCLDFCIKNVRQIVLFFAKCLAFCI